MRYSEASRAAYDEAYLRSLGVSEGNFAFAMAEAQRAAQDQEEKQRQQKEAAHREGKACWDR